MVLHKFQTRYSSMFETEMCNLKLNCSGLKFSRIMDFKNHVEITYERTLDKMSFWKFFRFKVLNRDYGSRS